MRRAERERRERQERLRGLSRDFAGEKELSFWREKRVNVKL